MRLFDSKTNKAIEVGETVQTTIGNKFKVVGFAPDRKSVIVSRGFTENLEVEANHIGAEFRSSR